MSATVESYDGLCGIIYHYSTSDRQVRCKYEFGHGGPHSWEKQLSGSPFRDFVHSTTLDAAKK